MCSIVWDTDNDRVIESVAELRAAVGDIEFLLPYNPDESYEETCLCPVDLYATLLKAGCKIWYASDTDRALGEISMSRSNPSQPSPERS